MNLIEGINTLLNYNAALSTFAVMTVGMCIFAVLLNKFLK